MSLTSGEIRGAVARAWCHPENANKVMDEKLALAAADEVEKIIRADKTPQLGCATTLELVTELECRVRMAGEYGGQSWPYYRTVDET